MSNLIFANPKSGLLRPDQKARTLEFLAAQVHGTVLGLDTKSGEELRDLIRAETKEGDTIYVAGGDGTFMDACNAVRGKDVTIAAAPLGTGCAMKSEFDIPYLLDKNQVTRYLVRMERAKPHNLDLIALDDELTLWVSAGIEGDICDRYNRSSIKGDLGYGLCTASALREHRPAQFLLTQDGEKRELTSQSLMATKFRFYGKGLRVMPAAKHDDGNMYVAARAYTPLRTPVEAMAAKLGLLRPQYSTAQELIIAADRAVKLQAAGDYKRSAQEFSLRVVPNAVKVLY